MNHSIYTYKFTLKLVGLLFAVLTIVTQPVISVIHGVAVRYEITVSDAETASSETDYNESFDDNRNCFLYAAIKWQFPNNVPPATKERIVHEKFYAVTVISLRDLRNNFIT